MLDERNFLDQSLKSDKITYGNNQKITNQSRR